MLRFLEAALPAQSEYIRSSRGLTAVTSLPATSELCHYVVVCYTIVSSHNTPPLQLAIIHLLKFIRNSDEVIKYIYG